MFGYITIEWRYWFAWLVSFRYGWRHWKQKSPASFKLTGDCPWKGRGEKTRTSDLHVPNVARCQLCYTPIGVPLAACCDWWLAFSSCKVTKNFRIERNFCKLFCHQKFIRRWLDRSRWQLWPKGELTRQWAMWWRCFGADREEFGILWLIERFRRWSESERANRVSASRTMPE